MKKAPESKKKEDSIRQKQIDNDEFWKTLLAEFFPEAIQLIHPKLYEAIDWSVPVVFIEQEFFNALKGRFKIKDKRKFADKLARLRLKSGEDAYIVVHAEAQHVPEDDFNKRMYIYRSLIYLWLDMDEITAIAIFTGAPPSADSLKYSHSCYDTHISYAYPFYIIAEQNEEELLKSDNPFTVAVLATLYTYQTINDAERRFAFKRKIFELAQKKSIPIDRMAKLLTFVKDFMYLPEALDREFEKESKSLSNFLTGHKMDSIYPYREGTLQIISDFLFRTTGKTVDEYKAEAARIDADAKALNDMRRQTKQAETQAKQAETQAKREESLRKQAEMQLKKAELLRVETEQKAELLRIETEQKAELLRIETEQKAELLRIETEQKAIFNLYSKVGLSIEVIAMTMDLESEYVKKVIDSRLEKQ
jgi:hypothetical protein